MKLSRIAYPCLPRLYATRGFKTAATAKLLSGLCLILLLLLLLLLLLHRFTIVVDEDNNVHTLVPRLKVDCPIRKHVDTVTPQTNIATICLASLNEQLRVHRWNLELPRPNFSCSLGCDLSCGCSSVDAFTKIGCLLTVVVILILWGDSKNTIFIPTLLPNCTCTTAS
jgi:hypothetical protein